MRKNAAEVIKQKVVETKTAPERKEFDNKKLKFSFREQREFEGIESEIAELEDKLNQLAKLIEIESSDYLKLQEHMSKKEVLEKNLKDKMERWVYLNDLADRIAAERK